MNKYYRAVFTNVCGTVTTTGALLNEGRNVNVIPGQNYFDVQIVGCDSMNVCTTITYTSPQNILGWVYTELQIGPTSPGGPWTTIHRDSTTGPGNTTVTACFGLNSSNNGWWLRWHVWNYACEAYYYYQFPLLIYPVTQVTTVNSCIGGGTVTFIESGAPAGGTWTVNGGGTINSSTGVFTPTTPGCWTATYTSAPPAVCSGSKEFVVFPAAPVIAAPANTCASPFTLPTVTPVSGFSVQYSIDGGVFSSSPTVPTTPGCHTVQARYVLATNCGGITAGTVGPVACLSNTVSVVIFPTAPVITAPVNTCNTAFTLPTVTAVAGFTVLYSIDGGAFSATPVIPTTPGCHSIIARYVLTTACGSTPANTAGTGSCGSSNTVNVVIFPLAPPAPVVNSGCGPIIVTPPPTIAGFNIEYSFDDGVTWGANTPPTADNCSGYKIKTRYVTSSACGTTPAGTVSTIAACQESPATTRIVDNTAPSIGGQGANATMECTATPSFTAPTASDACGSSTVRLLSDVTAAGSCANNFTRTRSWDAIDNCGNTSATRTQTITVADTQPPTIGNAGANATIECTGTPTFTAPTVSDACGTSTVRLLSDVTAAGSCANNFTRTRSWDAIDACGNTSATRTQTITVTDITAPVIGTAGANATIECTGTPSFTAPTASDACG